MFYEHPGVTRLPPQRLLCALATQQSGSSPERAGLELRPPSPRGRECSVLGQPRSPRVLWATKSQRTEAGDAERQDGEGLPRGPENLMPTEATEPARHAAGAGEAAACRDGGPAAACGLLPRLPRPGCSSHEHGVICVASCHSFILCGDLDPLMPMVCGTGALGGDPDR